ncbi:MAG: Gfo/Idh/MocA family oxidoreductase, partial [Woeseia sp.]
MESADVIELCIFGAGRIGNIHARCLHQNPRTRLRYVVDTNQAAAEALAAECGAKVVDTETALNDPAVRAVVIASSTDTHADLIERAAKAGKAIFCEKPIDLGLDRAKECAA